MLEEYIFKYRMLKPWARALLLVFIGVLPGAYRYMEDAEIVENELSDATAKEAESRQKLASAKAMLKDLPALEAKQKSTQELLKKVQTKLPNQIFIDQVVHLVSQAANEADVRIMKFENKGNKLIDGEYPYNEARFKVLMEGKYGRLGEWLDSVGGTKSIAYIKKWSIERSNGTKAAVAESGMSLRNGQILAAADAGLDQQIRADRSVSNTNSTTWTTEMAEAARQDIRLAIDTEFVMHFSATPAQLAESAAAKATAAAKAGGSDEKKPAADAKQKTGGA